MLLALVLKNLGDYDNARHAFEQAAKLNKTDASVALNYAVLLNLMGEKEKAAAQLRRFQELAEGSSELDQELLLVAQNLSKSLTTNTETEGDNVEKSDPSKPESGDEDEEMDPDAV
ncbi:hypothetical protein L9F63_025211 [Diploptera punctata]|uniref:Uncharacterized protein n=1 Tax=Diploptera punctata TaxID=6984 RepID=A0AAD7ZCB6_DIPPU|nr:hypothetical protein L9F63_025211 [Diploptera punctata]